MKWFKHLTDASDSDDFISELEDKFGLEGYARWFKLLEAVGAQMKKDGSPVASHSWTKWQTKLKGKRNKLETFLKHCENKQKITQELSGNILRIEIPNIKKIKDEYSSRSGHPPDNVHPKGEKGEVKEVKKGEGRKEPPPPVESKKPETVEEIRRAEVKAECVRFLDYAEKSHLEQREGPLVVNGVKAEVVVARLVVVKGLSCDVLSRCWDEFLRDEGKFMSGKPRTFALFESQVPDYLEKTRAVEREAWSKIEKQKPVVRINPDPQAEEIWVWCLKIIEAKIIPENFNTWFAPTFPLTIQRDRVAISVPNEYHAKCLAENYQKEIKAALAEVGITPAPVLEFLTQDAYELSYG